MSGPLPPHAEDAERVVLGLLLVAGSAGAEAVVTEVSDLLEPAAFYRPAHGAAFAAILELHRQGHPHDPTAVDAYLRRAKTRSALTAAQLLGLMHDAPTGASAAYYAELVADAAVRRRALQAGQRIIQVANDPGTDIEQVLSVAEQEIVEARVGAAGHRGYARRLRPTKASQVQIRRLRWLWEDRIVLGGLTLLAGREGLGKSTLACDLIAQVTRGQLAGEFKGEPCTCVYLHTEDARDTTIVPRLVVAGADLDRVVFVDAITADERGELESQPVFRTDVAAMAELFNEHEAALVVLDAATSTIDGKLDGDKDREMRRGLEAIARGIGERTDCAVLGIVHFGKRDSADTGKLILGSIAWSQVARSVLAVARDDENDTLILSATKANLAPGATPSLAARLVSTPVQAEDGHTNVARVEWIGETNRHARDLLAAPADGEDRTEREAAVAWLEDYLTEQGKVKSKDVKAAARKADIAERTLHRARKALGVLSVNEGFPRESYWLLPEDGLSSRATGTTDGSSGATPLGTTGETDPDLRLFEPETGAPAQSCHPHVHGTTEGAVASRAVRTGSGTTGEDETETNRSQPDFAVVPPPGTTGSADGTTGRGTGNSGEDDAA